MSDIERHIDEICARLTAEPLVASYQILRSRIAALEGYYRIAVVLANQDILEMAAYLQCYQGSVETVDYRFQWMSADRALRVRWDNTPHHGDLAGFPHHRHEGSEDIVLPGHPMDAMALLDEVLSRIR